MGEKVNIREVSDTLPRLFMKVLSEIFKYVVKVAYVKMWDYLKLFFQGLYDIQVKLIQMHSKMY